MSDTHNDSRAKIFAAHVRSQRAELDLTQSELARKMKEKGFPFHQQTIQRIEDLERPVRLDEAYALAEILKSSVDKMAWSDDTIHQNSVNHFMWGAASVTTGVIRGANEWLEESNHLIAHLEYLAEHEPESKRLSVGVALLTKMRSAMKEIYLQMDTAIGIPFLGRIFAEDAEELEETGSLDRDDPEPNSLDARVRRLLEAVPADPAMMVRTAYELQDIYVESGWKPGASVGGPSRI